MKIENIKTRASGLLCGLLLTGSAAFAEVQVTSNITTDTTWTAAEGPYILTDIIYVTNNASLTIEAGTLIKGEPRTPNEFDPGTLVITQGAKIFAEGTASNPIVFTSTEDDGNLEPEDRGLWGGLILLGNAVLNTDESPKFIEGLPLNNLGAYGGNNNADNSGILRYISIRHGGSNLADDNEINGLTMGALGSGTTIEYIEVFANLDDGFEWFGGTVNTKYLVSAFCGDDSFDWDQGFRGMNQFWFTIQAEDANRAAEMDGGTDPKNGAPYSTPIVANVTYIGSGVNSSNSENDTMFFDDFSGGFYYNSIFTDFGNSGVTFSDEEAGDSPLEQLDAGNLALMNNIWFGFAAGNTEAGIVPDNPTKAGFEANFARETIFDTANINEIVNPELAGISRVAGSEGLDPRPSSTGPATIIELMSLEDSFFTVVDYAGAFSPTADLWIAGWTALSEYGFIGSTDSTPYLEEGADDFGGGWYGTWLGDVNLNAWPWVYSAIGWFYAGNSGNSNASSWLYMTNTKLECWLYSSETVFPWVYGQPTGAAEGWWFVDGDSVDGFTYFFGSSVIEIEDEF